MALNKESLNQRIIKGLKAKGFVTEGEHARSGDMAEVIADAVVAEIQENALVQVTGGSSAGSYKVS